MILDIGIPCFNDSKYLKQCLASIDEYFVNNYSDIKVWVIDDESPYGEDYKKVISQFNNFEIELVRMEKNSGPGNCRNEVIYRGSANWITWIDDDDIFISNPLKNIDAFNDENDIIRSNVYNTKGKICVEINTYTNPVFGSIFNRKFLNKTDLIFIPELGIAGTEDSIFLTFSGIMAEKITVITSFIEHDARPTSNYTLSSLDECEDYVISLLPLCNLCYMTEYKDKIKNYQMLWDIIQSTFNYIFDLYVNASSDNNLTMKNYYLLIASQIFFKTILEFFPESKDIKPYIGKNHRFLTFVYYAYHYCDIDGDSIYTQYKEEDEKVNKSNFLRALTIPNTVTFLHFPTVYKGVINYSCSDMVKRGRKKNGYDEKYWN